MARIVAQTQRLRLREWDPGDETRFYDIMNRPDVMTYLGGVQTPEEWRAAYERVIGFQKDYGHTFWILEDADGQDILGFCGIKRSNAPGAFDRLMPQKPRISRPSASSRIQKVWP